MNASHIVTPHSHIFISYSRHDKPIMRRIEAALETHGFNVFVDVTDLVAGTDWLEELRHQIVTCENLVWLVSENSLTSKYCHQEIAYALEAKKRVFPVFVGEVNESEIRKQWTEVDWEQVARTNWDNTARLQRVFCRPDDDWQDGLSRLQQGLRHDIQTERTYALLLRQSKRWDEQKRPPGLLLSSQALDQAQDWLSKSKREIDITLQNFIAESARRQRVQNRVRIGLTSVLTVVFATLTIIATGLFVQAQQELSRTSALVAINQLAKGDFDNAKESLANAESASQISAIKSPELRDAIYQVRPAIDVLPYDTGFYSMALHPDGEWLAMLDTNNQVILRHIHSDTKDIVLDSFDWANETDTVTLAFTPDGKRLILSNEFGQLVYVEFQELLENPQKAKEYPINTITDNTQPQIPRFAFQKASGTQPEKLLVAISDELVDEIRVYDVEMFKFLYPITISEREQPEDFDYTVAITIVEDSTMFIARYDGFYWLNLETGELSELFVYATDNLDNLIDVYTAMSSPDGTFVIAQSSNQHVCQITPFATSISDKDCWGQPDGRDTGNVAFIDNRYVVTNACDKDILAVWDINTRQEVSRLYGHTADPIAVVVHGNEIFSVGGKFDPTLRIWDFETVMKLENPTLDKCTGDSQNDSVNGG
jgi:WD40 repeat protein